MVSAVWGVMMQLWQPPERMPVGQGLGIGDVEGGPGDRAGRQGGHQRIGVHVRRPGPR